MEPVPMIFIGNPAGDAAFTSLSVVRREQFVSSKWSRREAQEQSGTSCHGGAGRDKLRTKDVAPAFRPAGAELKLGATQGLLLQPAKPGPSRSVVRNRG
jgi:hypothetical protein